MKTVNKMKTMISKPLPACLTLAAALLLTAGCNPKTPAPTTETPAATTTQSAAPGQSPATITPDADQASQTHPWTDQQILTCTVSQCWHLANKSEDTFFDIVQQLAAISAQNRSLTLPQTEAAGQQVGNDIKTQAKADHDQLLYSIVDAAVRKVGQPAAATK
ncbi:MULTISPECIES: hypothetical protein [Acidobacteriaceae]|uniref:hypothetical protein n=1 Tax=Acidobacteriaceae TaxID=204434 RepID=UPI00131CC0A1|nr:MULTISPECIES: hypothetical protein [Acidobacteriaceae]MDW5264824.1 hypothetical protein [Edaphobacter sp.]